MLTNKFADEVGSRITSVAKENPFFTPDTRKHEQFMLKDLAKSGLTPEMIGAAVHPEMSLGKGAECGYLIPYYDLDGRLMRRGGELTMYRIRQNAGEQRYLQPSAEVLTAYGLPPTIPYVLPDFHSLCERTRCMVICEGEKKAAAVMNVLGLPAVGIGGCWNWGIKKKLHPWLRELIERYAVQTVVVIPDGDIKRYDICTAYGTLAGELGRAGVEVEIVQLPDSEDKIDDLLVEWGEESVDQFALLGKFGADGLVEDQGSLAERYGLSAMATKDGRVNIVNNDNNITRLLGEHPAFAEFWFNADTSEYMHGSEAIRWDVTDYELCVYMQHYFQLHNITVGKVASAMRALCSKSTRSPFKDWVDSHVWDGVSRLGDWPIRLWGCEDSAIAREVGLKFWVGMYARMASPGCKMDWMLVTVGGQGIGKSWWADLVSRGQFVTFMASGNARDDAAKLHRGLVILIDELDAFNKREMTYWKTMITTHVDTYRAPYAHGEVTMPRRSVLYGTSNHRSFLRNDRTGQRRFGVLEPKQMLDVEGLRRELGQLWAEARAIYEAGEVMYWELSAEVQARVRAEYQGEDPLGMQVQEYLDNLVAYPTASDVPGGKVECRFRMLDLLRYLGLDNSVQNRGITGPIKDLCMELGAEYRAGLRIGKSYSAGYVYYKDENSGGY